MAEPCSAAFGGRWSLAVPRPPSLHCQRQRAAEAAVGTCSGPRRQGCSCPSPRCGEAAAIPARPLRSRCRPQPRAGGRRCCLRVPGPAAASGSEHESARPRLLLHAQLLCKCCCFLTPSPPLPASGAVRQFSLQLLFRAGCRRSGLSLRLGCMCRSSCPGSAGPGVLSPAKGDPFLFPPTCCWRMLQPPSPLCCCPGWAQGHSSARLSWPEGPGKPVCHTGSGVSCLEPENYSVRVASPRGVLRSCHGVSCKAGVCKTPFCANDGVVGWRCPEVCFFYTSGEGSFLTRKRSDAPP